MISYIICVCMYVYIYIYTHRPQGRHGSRTGARCCRKGGDTVGNPHRAQVSQFEPFELILLFKIGKKFPVEQFEATASQSTVPPPSYAGGNHRDREPRVLHSLPGGSRKEQRVRGVGPRNPKPEIRNPKPETRNPKTETRNPNRCGGSIERASRSANGRVQGSVTAPCEPAKQRASRRGCVWALAG